jgi:putative phosphoesterase
MSPNWKRLMRNAETRVDARHCRRIGVLSDSHGPIDGGILAALARCDCLINAGDSGGVAALDALAQAPLAVSVRGNNDTPAKWGAQGTKRLRQLPDVIRIDVTAGHLIVIHGHQVRRAATRHEELRERYAAAIAVIYGHSHHRVIDCTASPWILNPGACGRVRTFGGPSALLLEMRRHRWHVKTVVIER